ncbi:MAG: glycosyltransferase family 39 protein, partial [Candidatus Hydrogenedentes bacterium]|nr:glycosyltransferase family 39 protein [Candidatus Hydrogenedentota bacterium]
MEPVSADARPRHPFSHRMLALGLVTVLWGLTLALVPPTGEFPLNDDWVYAQAVKDWMETGHYTGHLFSTAAFVGQAWWGRLFCELFGFSFLSLRWSTLVLWLAGAWATTLAALGLGARPRVAALAGTLIIANPLMMNLGYTFMTDVPFVSLMAISGLFYLRALEHPRWQWFLLGSLMGAAALLTRQFAVLLPAAFVVALCPWEPRWWRRESLPLMAALILPWAAAWGLLKMLPSHAAEMGYAWNPSLLGDTMGERIFGAFKFYGVSMTYLGLFALPLILGAMGYWFRHKEGKWQRRVIGFVLVMVPLTAAVCGSEPSRIPFLGNMLYDTGVGPMTLRGILMGSYLWRPVTIGAWWWIPTLVGLVAAGWMVAGTIRWGVLIPGDGRRPLRDPRRRQQCFLMMWAVLMVLSLYHPWGPVRFDRYLIGALVPVSLLVALAPSGRSWGSRLLPWG